MGSTIQVEEVVTSLEVEMVTKPRAGPKIETKISATIATNLDIWARDCPSNRRQGQNNQNQQNQIQCYNCQQFGHMARECPSDNIQGQGNQQEQRQQNYRGRGGNQHQARYNTMHSDTQHYSEYDSETDSPGYDEDSWLSEDQYYTSLN